MIRWPGRYDVALAAVFVALTLAEMLLMDAPGAALRLAAMVSLAWRRQAPEIVAGFVVISVVTPDNDGQYAGILAVCLVTFTLGNERPPRVAIAAVTGLGAVALLASMIHGSLPVPSDLAALFIFLVAPCLVGISQRRRMMAEAQAIARASRAEERRQMQIDQAVARERTRIARELHDVVSHTLTVVTINTQAVRRTLGDGHEREVSALRDIEELARQAGSEMRRLLGVLRSEDEHEPLRPQPTMAQLHSLVSVTEAAGIRLNLEMDPDLVLTGGADVTAYRIVQEALTNSLRHANATQVWVRVHGESDGVRIEVEDDGHGDVGTSAGHGLLGIRERANVYGGSVRAGNTEHGFRVEVTLPAGRIA
jgi:signal transduction histidine kinase